MSSTLWSTFRLMPVRVELDAAGSLLKGCRHTQPAVMLKSFLVYLLTFAVQCKSGEHIVKKQVNLTWDCCRHDTTVDECPKMVLHPQLQEPTYLGFFWLHTTQMSQVRFVPNQHDGSVGIRVFAQFFEPSLHILKCHCTPGINVTTRS